jgi:hypothetical protein
MGKVGMVLRRDQGHSATAFAPGEQAHLARLPMFSRVKSALLIERIVHFLR